jgi:hypothetical protein
MKDFTQWCVGKGLAEVHNDGTVTWTEAAVSKGKTISNKDDLCKGVRDTRKDLSDDYKDYAGNMGTVWPFKVVAKGSGKAVAPVGK